MLTLGNIAWWRVDMPDRTEDGELVTVPVRLKLKLFTRAELRQRQARRLESGIARLGKAMDTAAAAQQPDELKRAAEDLQAATEAFLQEETLTETELAERILGWRPEDVSGEAFTPGLRDLLLSDQARFNACLQALDAASIGAPRKN